MLSLLELTALAAVTAISWAAQCQNMTIPVTISARNGVFNITNPLNNIDTIDFSLRVARQGNNYTAESLEGYDTISGEYEIGATLCNPEYVPGTSFNGTSRERARRLLNTWHRLRQEASIKAVAKFASLRSSLATGTSPTPTTATHTSAQPLINKAIRHSPTTDSVSVSPHISKTPSTKDNCGLKLPRFGT
jgi:hypothetical protein